MDHEYISNVTGETSHIFQPTYDGGGSMLRRLVKDADSLGISLPKDALEHFQRAQDLKALAKQARNQEPPTVRDLARSLAMGETTPKKAEATLPTALAAQSLDLQKNLVGVYADAEHFARTAARRALQRAGDKLLAPVQKVAEAALEDHRSLDAQETWDAAQSYASLLRLMHLVPVAEGATDEEYIYANPAMAAEYTIKTGQAPSLAVIGKHREDFGPGIYSAADVVEVAKAYAQPEAGQDQEPGATVVWDRDPHYPGSIKPVAINRG